MTKDTARLAVVSKLFTEETLKTILSKTIGEENVTVTGWDFGEASSKGDSYLSTVDRIKIHGTTANCSIVVKSLPENLGRRKTYRSKDFFYNEIKFYTEVIPFFKKFLALKNQSDLLSVPKVLAYVLDGENDFIAMEDLTVHGYGPVCRQSTVSPEECQLIIECMARFHGISFACKNQNKADFDRIAGQLKETYFSEKYYAWYKNFHALLVTIAKDAMCKEFPEAPETKYFVSVDNRKFWEKSVAICGRSDTPTSVVNQGDAWAPNFLMRVDPQTGKKQALQLDFQLARCAGPISDLSFFMYSCTDKELRDNEFDNMLVVYYRELAKTIRLLGSDSEKIYSKKMFFDEVATEFVHGLCFSLESIPFSMLGEDESFDLDVIKGNQVVDIADVWTLKPIQDEDKRRRLANVIMHAIQHKFL